MREEAADVSLGLPYAVRPPTADSMPSSAPWPTADTAAPTLPPPPEGIQFAWAHPQRLLAGLASAEFSWGPAEQRQLEEYVNTALHMLAPEDERSAEEGDAEAAHVQQLKGHVLANDVAVVDKEEDTRA